MKRLLLFLLTATLMGAPVAQASDVDFGIDLHIGTHSDAPIVVHERPMFLAPAELGFHVAVGVPYDMFFIGGSYYVCKDHHWYRGSSYNGPWKGIGPKHLPHGLAKKRYRDIIRARDAEYVRYKKDKRHYKGKPYYPKDAGKSHSKDSRYTNDKSKHTKASDQWHGNDKHTKGNDQNYGKDNHTKGNDQNYGKDKSLNKDKSKYSKGKNQKQDKDKRQEKEENSFPEGYGKHHG